MKVLGRIRNILGALLLIVASSFISVPVLAEKADERPEYRIQISPVDFDLELRSGRTETQTFEVQNTGTKKFKYKLSVAPYTVTDDEYSADYENESQYTQIKDWIKLSKTEGEIESDQVDEITVTISVPQDAPGGGQYAVILAQIDNEDSSADGSSITLETRLGLKIYADINGTTRQGASIEENKIAGFLFNPPITATSIVKNTGNTHVKATYIMQVYPMFGDEEVYTNEEKPMELTILPETQRLNTMSWDGAPQLGVFRVKQTVKVLDDVKEVEKLVILCPIWFLFIIVLIIICIIFWIVSRIRNRNKE